MIEELLPGAVTAIDTRSESHVPLFPEEEAAVGQAVDKRRREFISARACARQALAGLGLASSPIGSGEHGEPLWPMGIVGSITHCEGYRACAVAHSRDIATIGIDAEPHERLPPGVRTEIARREELPWLAELTADLPEIHWDRLLFSAKESVYKAWFPLTARWLGFDEALVTVEPADGTFSAQLLVEGPLLNNRPLETFSGRWVVRDELVLTAVAVAADR